MVTWRLPEDLRGCLKQWQNKTDQTFVWDALKMVSFFTAASWEKDAIFGVSQINICPFLFDRALIVMCILRNIKVEMKLLSKIKSMKAFQQGGSSLKLHVFWIECTIYFNVLLNNFVNFCRKSYILGRRIQFDLHWKWSIRNSRENAVLQSSPELPCAPHSREWNKIGIVLFWGCQRVDKSTLQM